MKKYIVIEWIHWSWKWFVSKALTQYLTTNWINAKYYHFPDEESSFGKLIRQVVADKQLVYHWQVTWLLYASFANSFHIKTQDDDFVYILDRHSVTTWLVFQRQMSRSTRLEIYQHWIQALQQNGQVIFLKVDKQIAKQRSEERNKLLLNNSQEVWQDKAKDVFNQEKFDEMSNLYTNSLLPDIQKLWLKCDIVDNNWTLEQTLEQIKKVIF